MPKRFCPQGHDTLLTGRTPSSTCRECSRVGKIASRARKRARTEMARPVPHGVATCGCEMCQDRRLEAFMDAAHAQWDEAAWEAAR